MSTAVLETERRAANTHELIESVCAQFSDATGWTLEFTPVAEDSESQDWLHSCETDRRCWHGEIHDGQQRIGSLSLDLPEDRSQDRSYPAISRLADLATQLLNRICTMVRVLDDRNREVSTLVDLGLSIPRESDLLDSIRRLLRAVILLTGFRATGFFLLDPSTQQLHLRIAHELDAQSIPFPQRDLRSNPPDLRALMNGVAWLHRDNARDRKWIPEGAAVGVGVAVASRTGPIGTLWAFDRRMRAPSEREVYVLRSLAAQVALILERVVLLKESELQHRLQRELRIVSEYQPHPLLEQLPDDCGFEAALHTSSRYELGGDLCELIPIGQQRTIIAIGDASGDSIPAAIIMTAVRGALRALTAGIEEDMLDPTIVCDRVNRALYSITPAHQFMTFLYGILDASRGTFTYSNAGHPMPFHIRAGEVQTLESHGVILGVTPTARYRSSVVELAPRDTLILFSDGISEAMDRSHQMFRCEGILDAIRDCRDGTAKDTFQAIWSRYEQHVAGASEPDDRTLLIVQIV